MVSAYINFIENIFRNVNLTQANLYESLTVIFLSCFHVFFFLSPFPFLSSISFLSYCRVCGNGPISKAGIKQVLNLSAP